MPSLAEIETTWIFVVVIFFNLKLTTKRSFVTLVNREAWPNQEKKILTGMIKLTFKMTRMEIL